MGDGGARREAVLLLAGRKIVAKDMAGRKVRQECGGKEDKFARERDSTTSQPQHALHTSRRYHRRPAGGHAPAPTTTTPTPSLRIRKVGFGKIELLQ